MVIATWTHVLHFISCKSPPPPGTEDIVHLRCVQQKADLDVVTELIYVQEARAKGPLNLLSSPLFHILATYSLEACKIGLLW
jgi:hypothetical protein